MTEAETRRKYIDKSLVKVGWKLEGNDADVSFEYEVKDMAGVTGQLGYADYVLWGKDGLPLAVIEAKRTSKDANTGRKQASLYADCLEKKFGRRPMMFTTNGFDTYFWDDQTSPQRKVSGIFSKDDLQKLMERRKQRQKLSDIVIDDKITDRYYQKEAIRRACERIEKGYRKCLLVMATGTGKTRTASSLTDVLSRGKYVTNILFLADRTALVKQAKDDFKNYLPDMSLCNLCSNKDDKNARIVFSTYPTILNAIDNGFFTPAHFDLIIIDESHRSIFKKYRAIFEYFDAILVGLTATPKTEVDRNTYDFFETENNVPTYAYDYETAVYTDNVLVPYYNYNVKTQFLENGIDYNSLSAEDKERYEEDFADEDGNMPSYIPSAQLNKFIFNQKTIDMVLQDLMERGIKVCGGDRLGKTIIFAQNKHHAEVIVDRFNKLYPDYHGKNYGDFAQRVICDDSYAQKIIDDFKQRDKEPHIAVSVDMMDTGIDVPECVNLVFFKKVRSKAKFWQMIGRGTRLCKDLQCLDQIDGEYIGKKRFLIFDYCGNFEFFGQKKEGYESKETKPLTENIFCKQIRMIMDLAESDNSDYQKLRSEMVNTCFNQIAELNPELISLQLNAKYIEKYKDISVFDNITENQKNELIKYIAPLVRLNDTDEFAKRFDNFMYGLMIAIMEKLPYEQAKKRLQNNANLLKKKSNIAQVREKLDLIKQIESEEYWKSKDILIFEQTRKELRDLMQFIVEADNIKMLTTNLQDYVIDEAENKPLENAYDFEDYRQKVNRYVHEHGDILAIHKLTHNIPLSSADYTELERIFTNELGTKQDYQREYGDTPFGLLIRKIAKLDHEAAMSAFSKFINDESLNAKQIAFVNKIIHHIEENGYIESIAELQKPPFDKPVSFIKLFNAQTRESIVQTINNIKDNAVNVTA